ncbi:uncharacterized protein [Onthophagus taurus]|uniref:uncharacterized protein n=1 Tax=Onthophagus taurus TaxID=166361 RepID=UPI0039BECAB8
MNVKSATNKWLTKEIKNKTSVKRQLYEGMLMGKIDKEYTVFTNFIETAKNKVRATWNTINTLRQNKQSENLDLCDFQNNYKSNDELLNAINIYFANIAVGKMTNLQVHKTIKTNIDLKRSFAFYLTDPGEVKSVIMSLNNTSTVGYDEVPISVLKACVDYLAEPLSSIINLSFGSATYPHHLKRTLVRPLCKKGDKSDFSNYRPIALIPNVANGRNLSELFPMSQVTGCTLSGFCLLNVLK